MGLKMAEIEKGEKLRLIPVRAIKVGVKG